MHTSTVRNLLVRGMIAGVVAGLLAFALAYVVGEPSIDSSIALEESQSAPAHEHDEAGAPPAEEEEAELVTRPVQSTFGLATGVLVYGVALGGIASLAFAVCVGRAGRFRPRATAALVAGAAFTTVYLVPFLKYPATPPAVGNPDTIGKRTTLFFLMIVLSVLVAVIAVIAGRRLAPTLGNWNATVAAGGGYVLVMAVACLLLPANTDAVRETFPAALLWEFRLASLAVQAVLWTAFGLIFGALAERVLSPGSADVRAAGQGGQGDREAVTGTSAARTG
ncbi:CbtA family protein [Streptomyces sp. NBC_01498]|uniref:CbtA family protein n=1 Tax=Streptomyces sp. NBC_01498 TaxID=2975870 RepID=UPI002E7BCDA0|nr:CbtA family protein [Streptomyces sp. NBC_01498]WTL25303.1 CbtA family protein [Streptomyces sp. NBC_01498]